MLSNMLGPYLGQGIPISVYTTRWFLHVRIYYRARLKHHNLPDLSLQFRFLPLDPLIDHRLKLSPQTQYRSVCHLHVISQGIDSSRA